MTLPEIQAEAEKKYGIVKGDCRLTKDFKRRAKAAFIEKKMREFGLLPEKNKVT